MRVFVDLYKKGLIYRGKRMVNWCPSSLTALSDEEVVMKAQNAIMYHFKVKVVEKPGTWLTIATTRPETIPGDFYVAVNPKDERYADLIGKHVRRLLPLEDQGQLEIIGDEHVDFEFGTGVLKVTPLHDKADWEIYQRQLSIRLASGQMFSPTSGHDIEDLEVIDATGKMSKNAGSDLAGMDRFEARKKAAELLRDIGALVKEEPYQNNVGYSERADVPIEPRLSEQWFLKYPSVKPSQEVVAKGEMRFFPERWSKVYEHWMTGLQDWCVSRQVWWGHRVPVWTTQFNLDSDEAESFDWLAWGDGILTKFVDRRSIQINSIEGGELDIGSLDKKGAGPFTYTVSIAVDDDSLISVLKTVGFTQDPDVLDTWFSSWLWPFATMGWPEKTSTLKAFYPTTDLVICRGLRTCASRWTQ
jgi:valyl-tRNA synthetase